MKTKTSEPTRSNLTLTDFLMEQVEKLTDDSLTKAQVAQEIAKSQALTGLAEQIIKEEEVQTKKLDTQIRAVKTAQSMGLKFRPEELQLEELPPEERTKGITPEGLPYEL